MYIYNYLIILIIRLDKIPNATPCVELNANIVNDSTPPQKNNKCVVA